MKNRKLIISIALIAIFIIGFIIYLIRRAKKKTSNSQTTATRGSSTDITNQLFGGYYYGGGTILANSLTQYTVFSGYGTNSPYASIADAYTQNPDDNTDVQLTKQLWAEKLETGSIAYADASKTAKFPQGFYYYKPTNFAFSVDVNGVITLVRDTAEYGTATDLETGN